MCLVARIDTVTDALRLPSDDGQRGPQFVRQVCDNGAPVAIGSGEAHAHRVEGSSQRSEFARPALRNLDAVITGLDPAGSVDDIAQVDGHPSKLPAGANDEDHEQDEGGNGDEPHQVRCMEQTDGGPDQQGADGERHGDQEERGRDEPGKPPHEPPSDPAPWRPPGRRPGLALRPPGRLPAATPARRAPAAAPPARAAHRRASAKR